MYTLSEDTKKKIENKVGLSFNDIINTDVDDLTKLLEKKAKKKFKFLKTTDSRLIGRGSVFIFLNRFIDLDEVEKKLNKI